MKKTIERKEDQQLHLRNRVPLTEGSSNGTKRNLKHADGKK